MEKSAGIFFSGIYTVLVFLAGIIVGVWVLNNLPSFDLFSSVQPSLSPPVNYFSLKDIKVYNDKIVLTVRNASVTNYGSTGSMLPTLNENSNGIVIVPENDGEVKVGDIVSYRGVDDTLIVHRVVQKNSDGGGVYFVMKGDNSDTTEIIRFSQIEHKIVGILY